MSEVVAVTGSSGFVGQHLVRALLAKGYQVKALVRRDQHLLAHPHLTWVRGHLGQSAVLHALAQDADSVIHLAGAVRGLDYDSFAVVNVTGCSNLIEAVCMAAPKAKLLLVSSLAARHPELSNYARSKREGELLLEAKSIDWTIFRPTAIYGAGDTELLPLFRVIAKGVLPRVGTKDARVSLLYVEDFIGAILSWISDGRATFGKKYELADEHKDAYTWPEIGKIIGRLTGRSPVSVPVPTALLFTMAQINRVFASLVGYAPMLTPDKIREILHPDWRCSLSAARDDFGWAPQYQLEDGLKAIADWAQ